MHLASHIKNYKKALVAIGFILTFALLSSVHKAEAASLLLAPSASKITAGNIVSLKVLVNTDGRAVNNVDATVQFPVDLLEVVSVNKNASVFSLWVEEPKFSNYAGNVTFNGGLPSPGFVGQGGEVVSIVFRAKKTGTASVVFADSAVRQNDGVGTNILSATQPSTIEIMGASASETPKPDSTVGAVPAKPVVTSSTHPKEDAWYESTTASFSWVVPNGVTSIQTSLTKDANSTPTTNYDSSVTQKTVSKLEDGVQYFHIRYMNAKGWGQTTHYKIQTDTQAPEDFNLKIESNENGDIVTLDAKDALSGIDSYLIKIDDEKSLRIKSTSLTDGQYTLPPKSLGEHDLTVTAYDKAGNHTESHTLYTSTVAPSSLVKTSLKVASSYSFLGSLAMLLVGLLGIIAIGWFKYFNLKHKFHKEIRHTVTDIHSAFGLFESEMDKQLKKLDKLNESRELTKKEEKIFKELRSNLDDIEEYVEKKVKQLK